MMTHPDDALADLLGSLFSAEELRRFLRRGPRGHEIELDLPEVGVSLRTLCQAAILILSRLDLIRPELFARLKNEAPDRSEEIDRVTRAWSPSPAPAPRSRLRLHLDVEMDADVVLLTRLLTNLRLISNDRTLILRDMWFGSLILEVDTTHAGRDALLSARREGRLDRLAGLRLLRIDLSQTPVSEGARAPIPSRLTASSAQQVWDLRTPPELQRLPWTKSRYHTAVAAVAGAGLAMGPYDLNVPLDRAHEILNSALLSATLETAEVSPLLSESAIRVVLPRLLEIDSLSFQREGHEIIASVLAVRRDPKGPDYDELPEEVRDELGPDEYDRLVAACRPGSEASVPLPHTDTETAETLRVRIL